MRFKVLSKTKQLYNDKEWFLLSLEDANKQVYNKVSYWYDEDFEDNLNGVIETKDNGYLNFVMWSRNQDTKYMKLTDGDETVSLI